jgi:hypothetical protein
MNPRGPAGGIGPARSRGVSERLKVTNLADPDEYHAYEIEWDHREKKDIWTSLGESLSQLAQGARAAVESLVAAPQEAPSADVSNRLRAWGHI